MSIWTDASDAIDATFVDEELLNYTGAGLAGVDVPAIRIDENAPDFTGAGNTLSRVVYEIAASLFPQDPEANVDGFTHRGRQWRVIDAKRIDQIAKWQLTAVDEGPMP